MNNTSDELKTLSEIKSMMERSSRFISLSGLSGVFAGVFALIGAGVVYLHYNVGFNSPSAEIYSYAYDDQGNPQAAFFSFFLTVAICILVASLITCFLLTRRKASRQNLALWDHTSRRMIVNLFIPLATGGLFCLAMLYHHYIIFIAPATLIFYGLALLNAGKYTLHDIRQLGICEIIIGLIACFNTGNGLLFWMLGFGVFHIIYGTLMYFKYEREPMQKN